jgi:hypothetical protein
VVKYYSQTNCEAKSREGKGGVLIRYFGKKRKQKNYLEL